jgi:hypothetical protein
MEKEIIASCTSLIVKENIKSITPFCGIRE